MTRTDARRLARHACLLIVLGMAIVSVPLPAAAPAFFGDDPIAVEPETQDASKVRPWKIDLFIDLAINLFSNPGDKTGGVRAGNINTIDEVPDSSWFTNRIGAKPLSIDEARRGPGTGQGVAAGPWTVIEGKEVGAAPGFTIRDTAGEVWFISFDARGYPEAATGAIAVATKLFWTLGYWQTDNVLTSIRRDQVQLADSATIEPPSGKERRMRPSDLDTVWARAHRSDEGVYRAIASRRLPGTPLGGFRYHGTRPDDPNDIVPHEHRRELRALQVFGAWTNLVDLKAGNTLDVLITQQGKGRVRHYLQDVGSTFGTGANAPREYFEGWEHVYEGDLVWKRLLSIGFFIRPWQTVPYESSQAIGRFEGTAFDPAGWKPRVNAAALRHAQPDDQFWAARRVMAFSNDMIRALVDTGGYTRTEDARHLADILIQRRDKIGAAYLTGVTPLVDFALSEAGELSFSNAAVDAKVAQAPREGYEIAWSYFDNATSATTDIGAPTRISALRAAAPQPLRNDPGTFVRARIRLNDPSAAAVPPVTVYFRRAADRWTLVGIDRRG